MSSRDDLLYESAVFVSTIIWEGIFSLRTFGYARWLAEGQILSRTFCHTHFDSHILSQTFFHTKFDSHNDTLPRAV